jgi:hypothetical protein
MKKGGVAASLFLYRWIKLPGWLRGNYFQNLKIVRHNCIKLVVRPMAAVFWGATAKDF